jgi:hypothetical protein
MFVSQVLCDLFKFNKSLLFRDIELKPKVCLQIIPLHGYALANQAVDHAGNILAGIVCGFRGLVRRGLRRILSVLNDAIQLTAFLRAASSFPLIVSLPNLLEPVSRHFQR